MPVTPFHLGPAVVLKAACPRQFSLGVFALVQVVIDVETVARIAAGRYPIHAGLHTLAGSVLIALAVLVPGRYALTRLWAALAPRLGPGTPRWVREELSPITWTAAISGALLGGVSHVLLDALIHGDVSPLGPWRRGNALFVSGAFVWVHAACAALGLAGLVLWHALAQRRAR